MAISLNGTTGITDVDGGAVLSTTDYSTITSTLTPSIMSAAATDLDNKIINGNFRVWQRGGTQTTTGFGSADRWSVELVGGAITQSQQTFALGDTLGVNAPSYFLRNSVSGHTLASQYNIIRHPIESVRSYAGQTITVMGWAKRASGAGNMVIEGYQSFGTGGSFSVPTFATPVTVTLGTSWTPFAAVITVPSITGKTLGTNGNDYFGLFFWTSAGSDWAARSNSLGLQTIAVDLWGVHIRVGTWTATDTLLYRERDAGTEVALCQRYYETGIGTVIASYTGGNFGGGLTRVYYNVRKRAIPGSATAIKNNGVGTVATLSVGNDGLTGCGVWFNGGATVGDYMNFTYYIDAEI